MTYLLGLALALLLTGCGAIGPVPDTFNNYHDKPIGASSTPSQESEPDMATTPARKPAARAPARPSPSAKPPAKAPARPIQNNKRPAPAPTRPSR